MKDEEREFITTFSKRYGIPEDVIDNYIQALMINDIPSLDSYSLIMSDFCPFEMLDEMKKELKELIRQLK